MINPHRSLGGKNTPGHNFSHISGTVQDREMRFRTLPENGVAIRQTMNFVDITSHFSNMAAGSEVNETK